MRRCTGGGRATWWCTTGAQNCLTSASSGSCKSVAHCKWKMSSNAGGGRTTVVHCRCGTLLWLGRLQVCKFSWALQVCALLSGNGLCHVWSVALGWRAAAGGGWPQDLQGGSCSLLAGLGARDSTASYMPLHPLYPQGESTKVHFAPSCTTLALLPSRLPACRSGAAAGAGGAERSKSCAMPRGPAAGERPSAAQVADAALALFKARCAQVCEAPCSGVRGLLVAAPWHV